MDKKKIKLFIFAGLGLILISAVFIYGKKIIAPATMDNKINIATSFYPMYFLTAQLGGDLVNVINLTPAGIEPHDYELTAQDIIRIKKSKILFLNGGDLEIWSKDIENSLKLGGPEIINLGDDLMNKELEMNDEKKKDPHIWLDPLLAMKMAEKISASLTEIDSKNKDYYDSNLSVLKTKLINLDASYKKELAKCKKKEIITSHNAFGYLAQAYGLTQVSIAGLSPEEEPSSGQMAQIAKFAQEKEIKYIFFEKLVSPKLSETIAREIGAQTLVLNPIESLSKEELGQGRNYLTEMEANLKNLKTALECE